MYMFRVKNYALLSLLLVITFVMLGCGSGTSKTPEKNVQAEQPEQFEQTAQAEKGSQIVAFKGADGKRVLTFKQYADHDKIELTDAGKERVIKGRSNKSGSYKYKEAAADGSEKMLIAEVKRKSDSFKLFDESDNLLWKVKIKEDKIKISDNEENQNAFEIVKSSAERCKVRDRAAKSIGDVKFYPDNGKLKVKTAENEEVIITKDSKNVAAPGVVLFSEIPLELRAIIINELLRE
ncbi:MAG: hypothetical protein PHF29_03295 [Candidatus Riflebacteria bacterium]|nr:hypothetical protein [Candidatus Riflebacteria bacterium]